MNRRRHAVVYSAITLVFALLVPWRSAEAGTCKLSIMLDRSGSMATPRTVGNPPKTRCYIATQAARQAIEAYFLGDFYDIKTFGREISSTDDYDINCPNVADRLVSIWVFELSAMVHLTVTPASPDGFVSPATAIGLLQKSPYMIPVGDPNFPDYEPSESCSGSTPLAQTMCRSARDFASGSPAPGEIRKALMLTDGEENLSGDIALLPGEDRCRLSSEPTTPDPNSGWGAKVIGEFASRGVVTTGFLFGPPIMFASPGSVRRQLEPNQVLGLAPATAEDRAFFGALAQRTGGIFTFVPDNEAVEPGASDTDTDGDGIPDWRDLCNYPGCPDFDHDGIPDDLDRCPLSQREDGNGAFPADGCKDTDADGVPNDNDLCPGKIEDWIPPQRTDGCPITPPPPAVPALGHAGVGPLGLGLGLLGCAYFMLRRRRFA
jgi:hypothetical protein